MLGHAAEKGEGAVVRVEDHFLGFSGIGHDEHLTAEGQKDWECLNRKALAFLRLASIRTMLRKLCNPK